MFPQGIDCSVSGDVSGCLDCQVDGKKLLLARSRYSHNEHHASQGCLTKLSSERGVGTSEGISGVGRSASPISEFQAK